ncbi:MAG TPA: TonB-dependent siderophore receptor [Sphingomonadaceae bacterium]|nr:TonB-dependent siderophore receptor [Sphingomonadaceae bacterium]
MSFQSGFSRSILLAGAAATIAGPAYAEDAEERDYLPRDIVVVGVNENYTSADGSSGTKTPTALIDVPQAVGIITRDQLDDQGIRALSDALRYMPGVSLETGEGHRDEVFIRGQETTADFFLDGLRDDAQYYRPLYNIERVEVLKGANALIFGRGGGGGVVNRVSKQASPLEQFATMSGSVDSFGAWSIAGDLNAPLSMDAALRLNATYEEFANDRDIFDGRFIGVNPAFSANLGEATRFFASYSYDDDDRVTDRGLPSLNNLPLSGYDSTFFGDRDYNRATTKVHILRSGIEHRLSDSVTINATGQFADYDKFYSNIVPGSATANTVSLSGYQSATRRENLIGQVNLIADLETGGIGHTLLFGVEAGSQQTDSARDQALFDGISSSVTVPLAEIISVPDFTITPQRASTSDLATFSVYFQDQLELTDFLQLVAGIRFDSFDLEASDLLSSLTATRQDEVWSPRFGLVLKPQESLSLYASYSKSFLPASGDQFTELSTATATLEPEEFDNYEIGVKWAIRPELFFTAALFQLDRGNSQAPDPDNPGFVVLTGKSRVKGFELSIAGAVLPNLNISAGYTYLDGKFTTDTSAAPAGRRLQQLPEHQVSLWGRYDFSETIGIGLGVVHQSDQFASNSNTVVLPAYTRVDAAIYFDLIENLALQVNLENLLDEDYYPSAHGNNNIQPGDPFSASLGARLKF